MRAMRLAGVAEGEAGGGLVVGPWRREAAGGQDSKPVPGGRGICAQASGAPLSAFPCTAVVHRSRERGTARGRRERPCPSCACHPEERLAVGKGPAHPLADRVRVFARERENIGQEGYDALVHWAFRPGSLRASPCVFRRLGLPQSYFMLEIDRGEMPVERYNDLYRTYFAKKLLTYYEASRQQQYIHSLGISPFRVATVTTTADRVDQMLDALNRDL
jgi:hypothetical protein